MAAELDLGSQAPLRAPLCIDTSHFLPEDGLRLPTSPRITEFFGHSLCIISIVLRWVVGDRVGIF